MIADDTKKLRLPAAATVEIITVLLNQKRVIGLRSSIQHLLGSLTIGVFLALESRGRGRDGRSGRRRG